ncbi:uncharacterized protein LOC129946651 [Eupeodes corollae]|uniref:uncharacterized protein LOC129946651 n=1 Tax=Eupeodes corollae TaxID=290404 RepID=UPI0024921449|nr:uncharacterized protein LOC129946651 [Eupeodes corollae]
MALPYYLPPTIPTASAEEINQIYQRQNLHTIAFMQGLQYPHPPHVGYNFQPVPFKPYYTAPINSLNNMNFSHAAAAAPKIMYPIPPVALRPRISPVSSQSFQYQPRQVSKRVADADIEACVESKRHKPSEVKPSSSNTKQDRFTFENSQHQDLRLIPEDVQLRDSKKLIPLSGSRVNPLFVRQNPSVGNDLCLNSHNRQQIALEPGPGQQYITKIRSLVEGITKDHKRLISSEKSKAKEKKFRQKFKINESLSKMKRIISDIKETELKSFPSYFHPDPESYVNDHLVIGSNGTFISKSFYETISWKHYNNSTRILIGHYFNNYTLATQTLDGDNPLNPSIIEDIISHVMEKCKVGRDFVRDVISSICADEANRRKKT